MSINKKATTYLTKTLPQAISSIGAQIQQAVYDSYMAGYEDALNSNIHVVNAVTCYASTLDDSNEYRRGKDNLFYSTEANTTLSDIGMSESNFTIPEYKPCEAVNSKGDVFRVNAPAVHGHTQVVVHSLLPKPDGSILASVGPSIQEHLSGNTGMFVVNINELSQ